jgi:NAD-dependent dihydropyrimidine dehydrogenase PreA subunit
VADRGREAFAEGHGRTAAARRSAPAGVLTVTEPRARIAADDASRHIDLMLTIGVILLVLVGVLLTIWIIGERGSLMRRSTWTMMREGRGRPLLNSLHAYVYGRWTNAYLDVLLKRITPRLDEHGKKHWRDRYHGKVLTEEHARAIVMLDKPIERRDLDQIIPYPMARDLVLSAPPDIAVIECGCRHARKNGCEPRQVCMVVGQPFVDFCLEHKPNSRRLTQQEALDLIAEEHKRGHVHSAWFKNVCLDRFYAICNCCKCCCGGIEQMMKYGSPVVASSGFVAKVEDSLCNGCGICIETCAFDAMSLPDGTAIVAWDKCMGCGVCTGQCAVEAVTLERDERKGIPLDVRMMHA